MPHPFSVELHKKWKEIVLKQQTSGLSIAAWCKQNNVSDSKFYYWRDRLLPKSAQRESFVELKDERPGIRSGVSIECNGYLIHLDRNFDIHVLNSCLTVLKKV